MARLNGADSAAARGSEIALITAGEMKGGYLRRDLPGFRRKSPPSSQSKITIVVPSGYVPAGRLPLQVWIGGVKVAEDATVICR